MQNEIEMLNQLARIEAKLDSLFRQPTVKGYYTVSEFARKVDRAEFTTREWCRLGRIRAEKRSCGRGDSQEWSISHEELVRYQNHGLLPERPR
ncbi:MAG: hypothetical protein ACYSWU_00835 [Planctomycetota bacterium]|jgi:hypothetical protein